MLNTLFIPINLQRDNLNFNAGLTLAIATDYKQALIPSDILHPNEFAKYDRYKVDKPKYEFMLGRLAAKLAIQHVYPQFTLTEINVNNGIFHQPIIAYPHIPYQISITHHLPLASSIIFEEAHPMGIDIEDTDRSESIAAKGTLTAQEQQLALANTLPSFSIVLWAAKESLAKILRTGFTIPLEILAIDNIEHHTDHYVLTYCNFLQYKAMVIELGHYILSITLPKNTQYQLDIAQLHTWYQQSGI
ncbi:MAG: hypothetical protein Tsb005_10370 [Gammaproteobacteria bacterium]